MIQTHIHIEDPLQHLIGFLERTKDDSWGLDVVRNPKGQNCLFGHIFDWGGNIGWEWFENVVATTYMVFPVNDGQNLDYAQSSAKERCIAYLKDIQSGKQQCVAEMW